MLTKFLLWVHSINLWLFQPRHRDWCRTKMAGTKRAFVTHPHETGETYLQHLWFTVTMSVRFIYVTIVLFLHGVFPFLLTRAASSEVEAMYRIMKSRIPKERRDKLDVDYHV